MDNAFQSDAPIVFFKQHFRRDPGPRKYILWPMWVYRVVAPELRKRQLNVLKSAVLGMRRAGLVEAGQIALKLAIDAQLAAVISLELLNEKLVDEQGRPTPKGINALKDEASDAGKLVVGHVFQDPWSGKLWHRFITQLSYAQCEVGRDGKPILVRGPVGKPRKSDAYMHLPSGIGMPSSPDAAEILDACRWHRSAIRGFEPGFDEEGSGREVLPADPERLERIALIDEQPQACFVVTTLYLPKDDRVQSEWFVTDPFGLEENVSLHRAIQSELTRSVDLRREVGKLIGRSLDDHRGKQLEWLEAVRTQSATEVERRLTVNARRLTYFEGLVSMESAIQQATLLSEACPEDLRRNVLTGARRVLEAVFGTLAGRYPLHGIWKPLYVGDSPNTDRTFIRQAYEAAREAVGFAGPLPEAFASIKPSVLRSACGARDNWRLRPMIMATVLAARKEAGHPFRRVARVAPTLLSELDVLVEAAGDATHAGGEAPTVEACKRLALKAYETVALLEDLPFEPASTEAVES
jgi:hypothetical protein